MPIITSPRQMNFNSRLRIHPVGVPVSIATLSYFGNLKVDEKNSTPNTIAFKSTKHVLYYKDFEKIMSQTAIQYQICHSRDLVLNREFRVRIKMPEEPAQYWHVNSLKIVDVESKIVEFRWKPTSKTESNENSNGYERSINGSYRDFWNIFGDHEHNKSTKTELQLAPQAGA